MTEFETHPKDRKKARRVSVIVNIVLIILLLVPFMSFQVPPPGEEGILVSFGMPDMGRGDDQPDTQQEEEVPPQPVEEIPEPAEPEPVEEQAVEDEVVTQEDPNAIALKKKEEEEARKKAEKERQEKLEEQRRQEAEAKKKAEYDEAKKQFGDLFGGGKGETDTEGNQGDPLGDPNSDNLEGLSTGSGSVGGGLGGRKIQYKPQVVERSQKTGRVVVRVCVGDTGKVISADFTQRGSTTGDSDLVTTALKFAKQYRFSESTVSRQCGTITFDFKVK
ncbi:cell envelope integrity protein TolA [Membranicola marinus]|uniref:Cell envelope integrity protein TolA n=1 Tax=Membranihabitans marinus TaxID=1227546 RepID=A0A953LC63_9BACT|nr:cell envelope integrity protein TolA [Membranihabitans marinus]MBY5957434.1 cell envelope integrity protein TolA [Membranihabitans marinus]